MKTNKILELEKISERKKEEVETTIKNYNKKIRNIGADANNFTSEKEKLLQQTETLQKENNKLKHSIDEINKEMNELRGKFKTNNHINLENYDNEVQKNNVNEIELRKKDEIINKLKKEYETFKEGKINVQSIQKEEDENNNNDEENLKAEQDDKNYNFDGYETNEKVFKTSSGNANLEEYYKY